jgi:hypothetical protein
MPEYIIRILRQIEIFQKVEERIINAPSEASARREASYILAEEFADKPDIVTEVEEKKAGIVKDGGKYPF